METRVLTRDISSDVKFQWGMELYNNTDPAHDCKFCKHDGALYNWENPVCNECFFNKSRPNFEVVSWEDLL